MRTPSRCDARRMGRARKLAASSTNRREPGRTADAAPPMTPATPTTSRASRMTGEPAASATDWPLSSAKDSSPAATSAASGTATRSASYTWVGWPTVNIT